MLCFVGDVFALKKFEETDKKMKKKKKNEEFFEANEKKQKTDENALKTAFHVGNGPAQFGVLRFA